MVISDAVQRAGTGQEDALSRLSDHQSSRQLLRERLVPRARESGGPLSLALIDVDDFAAVNDTHGHACGDAVLQALARTLQEVLPDTAVMSRWGGDEFCVALPDTRLDDAFTLMEDLRRRVAARTFDEWPEVRVTCSIGLAVLTGGEGDVELVRAADQALYVAKVTGRNKVSLPLADSRMVTKTSYYTTTQLERLARLAKEVRRNEATLLREALDDLLKKYNDQDEQNNLLKR